jgi:hypothetical protein
LEETRRAEDDQDRRQRVHGFPTRPRQRRLRRTPRESCHRRI